MLFLTEKIILRGNEYHISSRIEFYHRKGKVTSAYGAPDTANPESNDGQFGYEYMNREDHITRSLFNITGRECNRKCIRYNLQSVIIILFYLIMDLNNNTKFDFCIVSEVKLKE